MTQGSRASTHVHKRNNKLPSRGRPRNPPTKSKPRQIAPSTQQPPKHLKASKAWWQSIVDAYELEQHQFRILLVACETLDRREQARALLKKHGLTFTDDKGMIRQRPEVCIERDSSAAFLRALRALKLEGETHDET
jgi:phage terminase small subunit